MPKVWIVAYVCCFDNSRIKALNVPMVRDFQHHFNYIVPTYVKIKTLDIPVLKISWDLFNANSFDPLAYLFARINQVYIFFVVRLMW